MASILKITGRKPSLQLHIAVPGFLIQNSIFSNARMSLGKTVAQDVVSTSSGLFSYNAYTDTNGSDYLIDTTLPGMRIAFNTGTYFANSA